MLLERGGKKFFPAAEIRGPQPRECIAQIDHAAVPGLPRLSPV